MRLEKPYIRVGRNLRYRTRFMRWTGSLLAFGHAIHVSSSHLIVWIHNRFRHYDLPFPLHLFSLADTGLTLQLFQQDITIHKIFLEPTHLPKKLGHVCYCHCDVAAYCPEGSLCLCIVERSTLKDKVLGNCNSM